MQRESVKAMLNTLVYIVMAYLGLAILVFIFQRSLLYFPDNQIPSKVMLDSEGLSLWPSSENYRGVSHSQGLAQAKGTVVVFHGNAGSAFYRSYYIDALIRQNLRVILAEYPGYGGRKGALNESSIVADGVKTLELVSEQYQGPIYLWGESLGAGVVASITSQTSVPIKGLVLFTPWDSLGNVAQTHYWYLPAKWLIRDPYDSVKNLKNYQGNVAVVLAQEDEVIPTAHGKRLYESIGTNKKLWSFEGARHNTIPIAPTLPWWQEVADFITQ